MTHARFSRLLAACLPVLLLVLSGPARADKPVPVGPSYIRLETEWAGFWPHGGEYVEYAVGADAQLRDAYHVMLKPALGMMLTFADKKNFARGKSLLEGHRQWELDYWRKNVGSLDSKDRADLAGGRPDLMVTEIDLPQQGGTPMKVYMIGAATTNGVFVFSISPITGEDEDMVRKLIASIKVVHKKLDITAEAKRLAAPEKKQ